MADRDPLELAKWGEPEAIARLLNEVLQPQGITVSVDRDDTRLLIGLYSATVPDQTQLIPQIYQQVRSLQIATLHSMRLFGYRMGELVPVWSERIYFDDDAPIPSPKEPDWKLSPDPAPNLAPDLAPDPERDIDSNPFVFPADQPLIENMNQDSQPVPPDCDRFIVCGLGSLGQYCVFNLTKFATAEFGIHITAIDRTKPDDWEVDDLPSLLAGGLIVGNCCRDEILLKAGIEQCRAVLIVTSNESDNIETAIAVHKLTRQTNPRIRIVVRSSRTNLNQLLKQQLGDFVALEPTELPASTFALEALGEGTLGFFNIGDRRLRVVQQQVQPKDYRFDDLPAHLMHRRSHRLISFDAASPPAAPVSIPSATHSFFQWHPETRVRAGDCIAYVEILEAPSASAQTMLSKASNHQWFQQGWQQLAGLLKGGWWTALLDRWQWVQANRTRQLISLGLVLALVLWMLGTVLLKASVAGLSWQKAMSAGVILLLGGYGDVFGGLDQDPVPAWVQLICLMITTISLLFVLGALGLVADSLLSSRFAFFRRRSPIPKQDHIVVVGLGRVGRRVAALLQDFKQPLVAIADSLDPIALTTQLPPQLPILIGDFITELRKANLATARSIILVTEDQMFNLEAALIARNAAKRLNRNIGLVIRTYDQRFSNNLMKLLPDAKALSAYELSAEAFVGSAFGETMLSLFRLNDQTILVADYTITATDQLNGKLLAEVAYGYGVVPIYYRKGSTAFQGEATESFMPQDDLKLNKGDRLIVLASINGLRRIERGELMPPRPWRLIAQKPLNESFIHYSGNDLARITGCSLDDARAFMQTLPNTMELRLYDYQAHRLLQELSKQLPVTLEAIAPSP